MWFFKKRCKHVWGKFIKFRDEDGDLIRRESVCSKCGKKIISAYFSIIEEKDKT